MDKSIFDNKKEVLFEGHKFNGIKRYEEYLNNLYIDYKKDDGKNHGLGLWEVRKILKKNNNLNLFTTKTNKLFKQQLEIYI